MSKNRTRFKTALLLAALAGCSPAPKEELPALCRLESYAFSAAAPLADRITLPPAELVESFAQVDGRTDYSAYKPSGADKKLVLEYLRLLPPAYEQTFRRKCVGLYFVSNFIGNGVTNWVIGPGGEVYFYIILNPASLKANLSETLTERERSCFLPVPGWEVRVEAGRKYRGLLYALFHEGTHGLDYAAGITPYTDDTMPARYFPASPVSKDFFSASWAAYSMPAAAADFPGRDRITFYGLGGGPRLRADEAPALYEALPRGGFVSLYGAKSWAEDLAELATFGLITGKLNQPCLVAVKSPSGTKTFRPMAGHAGKRAKEALGFLEKI